MAIKISQVKNKKAAASKSQWSEKFSELMTKDISFGSKKMSDKKKINFYNDLSILLSSGIDLRTTLDLMCDEAAKKDEKELYAGIRKKVLNGASLSEAIGQSGKFSMYEYQSIKIGEETGCLSAVLQDLLGYYAKKIEQQRKMKTAFSYPVFVLGASLLAVVFMMTFVVPMFEDIFTRFGNDLPAMTKMIINISNFISGNILLIIIFLLVLIIGVSLLRKQEKFRQMQAIALLRVPFFGELSRKMYLARFCLSMSLLTNAHIPLLQALSLVRKMITFYPLQKSIDIIENDILHGKTLHESMSAFAIYDKRMVSLVKVGEEVNQLGTIFDRLKTQYMDDVDYQTSMVGGILEPLMIVVIGIFVGAILISMYLPIFKLSTSIGF
jgi:type IV pilus assembly protein PilC